VPASEVTALSGFSTRVDRLRRRLTELGLNVNEVAAALGAELHLRPRAAYRYAAGMSGQAAAEVYNTKFGTTRSPAPMSKTRISEYENWPLGRSTRRPSPTVLHNLAEIYHTSAANLVDHHDRAALTDQQHRALIVGSGRPSVSCKTRSRPPPAPPGSRTPGSIAPERGSRRAVPPAPGPTRRKST
jgi:transcriptional regulator with XRE-family HTH domain